MQRAVFALIATIGFGFAALAASVPGVSAQDAGSLIIGVSICPEGYEGEDYAADCGSTPAAGIDFTIATPNTDNTETTTSRGDGLVTFSLAPFDLDPSGPDRVSVGEPAAQTLGPDNYAVFCTKNDGEPLDFSYETLDFEPGGPLLGISFDFETGDQIACEWYNIPQPMHPGDDDGDEVGQLPNTGIGNDPSGGDRFGGWSGMALLFALTGGAAYGLRRRAVA